MAHDDLDDADYDADRYNDAAGWDATKYQKKWRPKPPRKAPLFVEPKDEEAGCSKRPLRPLFGDLWGEREVAVLAGETGVGKSVLAVQLAELLARGRLSPLLPPRRVLYVDFEHTTNQFEDRYSEPAGPATPPGASAIVSPRGSGASCPALIRNLTPVSILVTACLRSGRTPGPIELRDLAGSSRIAELADTVFTLGRSHAGDDLRYLKHLKSRTATPTLNHENTPVLQLSRLTEPPLSVNNGHRTIEKSSLSTGLSIVHSPLSIALPQPFLGMTFIGPSAERDHFPTPEKPARTTRPHKDAELLEFVLTGKYARYLER